MDEQNGSKQAHPGKTCSMKGTIDQRRNSGEHQCLNSFHATFNYRLYQAYRK